jgi:hypothetical protein
MQDVRALDGVSFADWFKSHGGTEQSLKRMWDPIGEPTVPAVQLAADCRRCLGVGISDGGHAQACWLGLEKPSALVRPEVFLIVEFCLSSCLPCGCLS